MKRMWDEKELIRIAQEVHNRLGIDAIVVESLPDVDEARKGVIYLVPSEDEEEDNIYEEYILTDSGFELIGTTAIDLSGYAKEEQGFNVINASDIVNNTMTQEQYDLLTNGKPTRVIGRLLNLNDDAIGGIIYGFVEASGNRQFGIYEYIEYGNPSKIYRRIQINTLTTSIEFGSEIFRINIFQNNLSIYKKPFPSYPADTTKQYKLVQQVGGTLDWVEDN